MQVNMLHLRIGQDDAVICMIKKALQKTGNAFINAPWHGTFCIGVFLVLGLLVLTWFNDKLLITSLDNDFPLSRIKSLIRNFYVWDIASIGCVASRTTAGIIPYELFLAFSELIGLSIVSTQKVLFYIWFTSTGLGMYFLAITCKRDNVVALAAGIFYMLNAYTLVFYWHMLTVSYVYTFLPPILALYIKGITDEKKGLKYAFLSIMLWTVVSGTGYVNPANAVITWMPIGAFLMYFVFVGRGNRAKVRHALLFTGQLFLLWALINSYWLIPQIYLSGAELAQIGLAELKDFKDLITVPLVDSMRQWGYWEVSAAQAGDSNYLWGAIYASKFFVFISFITPMLAFSTFLSRKRDNHSIYFSLIALTSLFLISSFTIIPDTLTNVLGNVAVLRAFWRGNELRFGILLALAYAFLAGDFLGKIWHFVRGISKCFWRNVLGLLLLILVSVLFGVYMWPFWTGDIIHSGGNSLPSNHVKIPDYYFEAANWLESESDDFRIYPLPFCRLFYGLYSWDQGYLGYEPSLWLFPKPVIARNTGLSYELPLLLAERFSQGSVLLPDYSLIDPYSLSKVLALLDVKYVMFHRDANWECMNRYSAWWVPMSFYTCNVDSKSGISLEKSFGELDFYRNTYWHPMRLYAASKVILLDGGIQEMISTVASDGLPPEAVDEVVILLKEQLTAANIGVVEKLNKIVDVRTEEAIIASYDGLVHPFIWSSVENGGYAVRYYKGWKSVVRTDSLETGDTLSFPSLRDCPYEFPACSLTGWNAYNSTIIYVKTGDLPLRIDGIYDRSKSIGVFDLNVWWETGWMGMTTKSVRYPIIIPPNQRAIIQIESSMIKDRIVLRSLDLGNLSELSGATHSPSISFRKINPTKYEVHINTATPFFLVFNESYHRQWKAYYGKVNWFEGFFRAPISNNFHFTANGFANAWYLDPMGSDRNKDGNLILTLYFQPQNAFYTGVVISGLTVIGCLGYVVQKSRRRNRLTERNKGD